MKKTKWQTESTGVRIANFFSVFSFWCVNFFNAEIESFFSILLSPTQFDSLQPTFYNNAFSCCMIQIVSFEKLQHYKLKIIHMFVFNGVSTNSITSLLFLLIWMIFFFFSNSKIRFLDMHVGFSIFHSEHRCKWAFFHTGQKVIWHMSEWR